MQPNKKELSNPLDWWRKHQALFPVLARLARIYLAQPATSAPSKRIVSVASRIISAKRTSLGPDIAGKILYIQENWDWWIAQLKENKEDIDYKSLAKSVQVLEG